MTNRTTFFLEKLTFGNLKWIRFLFVMGMVVPSVWASDEENPELERIAVFPFDAQGLSNIDTGVITKLFGENLIQTGSFRVIDPEEMEKILGEEVECRDPQCASEIGKRVDAKKATLGTLLGLGKKIIVTVRVIDVATGEVTSTGQLSTTSLEEMDTILQRMAMAVAAGKPVGETVEVGVVTQKEKEVPLLREESINGGINLVGLQPLKSDYGNAELMYGVNFYGWYEAPEFALQALLGYRGGGGAHDTGADLSIFWITQKKDFAPYIGGGMGLHSVGYTRDVDNGYFFDEKVSDGGFSVNFGGGLLGFRTYSHRVNLDARYSIVFAELDGDPRQHSLSLSFGMIWKGGFDWF